jgi:hypothetical protein
MTQELLHREADILYDLAQEPWRNVSPGMIGYGGAASVIVPILHVRAALPHKLES